ncbi:MAG: hypothetical protein FWH59_00760 [Lentimicrobiaceae bacterium]|nr:hypothetical protein [Lentimicrobiaceae bacterium]
MKSKLFLLSLSLIIILNGFSQEKRILLEPSTDFNTTVALRNSEGKETGIRLPVILVWDNRDDVIQVEFKNIKSENPLYLFSGVIPFNKVKKAKKEITFSKEIKRTASPKRKARSVGNDWLINAKTDATVKPKIYNLQDPPGATVKFKVINSGKVSCSLLLKIYAGSNFTKGKKNGVLIESISEIKFDIDLKGPCQDAALKDIISQLNKKIKEINTNTTKINTDRIALERMSVNQVKNTKPKPASKDKRINSIADEKYMKYGNCAVLVETVTEYNASLDSYENAMNSYNDLLEERRGDIPYTPANNCQSLKTANEKLMSLYYKMEQSKDHKSFQTEYDNIINGVEENESCKEYAAYKEWCKGIEKLLKK